MPGGGETFCRWTTRERERLQFFFTKDMSFLVLSFHILSFLGHVNAIMYINTVYIYMYMCVCFFQP